MNLEEELNILNNSVDVTSNVFEPAGQAQIWDYRRPI